MKCYVCKKKFKLLEKIYLWYGKKVCRECGMKLKNAGKRIINK